MMATASSDASARLRRARWSAESTASGFSSSPVAVSTKLSGTVRATWKSPNSW